MSKAVPYGHVFTIFFQEKNIFENRTLRSLLIFEQFLRKLQNDTYFLSTAKKLKIETNFYSDRFLSLTIHHSNLLV